VNDLCKCTLLVPFALSHFMITISTYLLGTESRCMLTCNYINHLQFCFAVAFRCSIYSISLTNRWLYCYDHVCIKECRLLFQVF